MDVIATAGHVDDGDPALAGGGREIEPREAELGGDAARLLDGQSIGVDAGQRADERGLAVIDVTGSPEDNGMDRHGGTLTQDGSRSSRLRILPVGFRGSSSRNTTLRGRLKSARPWRQ